MASREPELYKDKIEVSLDGRQIFYLFFGGAVIIGLVFVLGVMTGRRVEARSHVDRAETPSTSDPLAALDRLERSDDLSFRRALTGGAAPTDVDKAIGEIEKRRTATAARADDRSHPDRHDDKKAKKHEDSAGETRSEARPEKVDARSDKDARPEKAEARSEKSEAKPDRAAKPEKDAKSASAEARPEKDGKAEKAETKPDRDSKAEARSEGKASSESKLRFTLQLSSFQDKAEAEAFLGATKAAGYQAYLTEADVSGKGTFYRVRLGSYRSLEAANDAKAEYEKSARKAAQIMRL